MSERGNGKEKRDSVHMMKKREEIERVISWQEQKERKCVLEGLYEGNK